jgi:hypothetical protein
LEVWASLRGFQPKGGKETPADDPGNPTVSFHAERRSNQTHASTTDPDALLARKGNGKEAEFSCAVRPDEAYDTKDFVAGCRNAKATRHVAQNRPRGVFGWPKTIAPMRKVRHRGSHKVAYIFPLRGGGLQSLQFGKYTSVFGTRRVANVSQVSGFSATWYGRWLWTMRSVWLFLLIIGQA